MVSTDSSSRDFRLGNMCDDLLKLTLEMCGKAEDNCPRFPRDFYDTYVKRIIDTTLDIHEMVHEGNEMKRGGERRLQYQQDSSIKCVYLNKLVRIAYDRGHISEKQRDRWQKLITAVKWGIIRWMESDAK